MVERLPGSQAGVPARVCIFTASLSRKPESQVHPHPSSEKPPPSRCNNRPIHTNQKNADLVHCPPQGKALRHFADVTTAQVNSSPASDNRSTPLPLPSFANGFPIVCQSFANGLPTVSPLPAVFSRVIGFLPVWGGFLFLCFLFWVRLFGLRRLRCFPRRLLPILCGGLLSFSKRRLSCFVLL